MKTKTIETKTLKKKYTFFTDIKKHPATYAMLFLPVLYTFFFSYCTYPFLFAIFQDYKARYGLFESPFIGLENFKLLLANPSIWRATYNTLFLNILGLVTGTALALALAVGLHELRAKWFPKITIAIMLFPNFLSWVIVSYMIYAMLGTYGLLNSFLANFGIAARSWYTLPEYWPAFLTMFSGWKGAGMSAIIYTSAISAIDPGVYEAARIDGASKWQCIFKITLPMLVPTILTLTLMGLGNIFSGNFDMIYAIVGDNSLLYSTTDIINTFTYRMFRSYGNISQSITAGFLQSVLGFTTVVVSNHIVKKNFDEGAIF